MLACTPHTHTAPLTCPSPAAAFLSCMHVHATPTRNAPHAPSRCPHPFPSHDDLQEPMQSITVLKAHLARADREGEQLRATVSELRVRVYCSTHGQYMQGAALLGALAPGPQDMAVPHVWHPFGTRANMSCLMRACLHKCTMPCALVHEPHTRRPSSMQRPRSWRSSVHAPRHRPQRRWHRLPARHRTAASPHVPRTAGGTRPQRPTRKRGSWRMCRSSWRPRGSSSRGVCALCVVCAVWPVLGGGVR